MHRILPLIRLMTRLSCGSAASCQDHKESNTFRLKTTAPGRALKNFKQLEAGRIRAHRSTLKTGQEIDAPGRRDKPTVPCQLRALFSYLAICFSFSITHTHSHKNTPQPDQRDSLSARETRRSLLAIQPQLRLHLPHFGRSLFLALSLFCVVGRCTYTLALHKTHALHNNMFCKQKVV